MDPLDLSSGPRVEAARGRDKENIRESEGDSATEPTLGTDAVRFHPQTYRLAQEVQQTLDMLMDWLTPSE